MKHSEDTPILKIGNLEVPLGFESISGMLGNILDCPENQPLLHELAKQPSAEIRQLVARLDNLDAETVHRLSEDEDPEVLESLMMSKAAQALLEYERIAKLAGVHRRVASAVANSLDAFEIADPHDLAHLLRAHPDPQVRGQLATCWSGTPKQVLRKLTEDRDPEVALAAQRALEGD